MDAVGLVQRLHEHRMFVNQTLLDVAQHLAFAQLHESFPIGQGSVWKSLLHLYAADFVWLEALLGNDAPVLPGDLPDRLPGNQLGHNAISSLGQLGQAWSELDQRWRDYLSQLSGKTLDDIVYKVSVSSVAGCRLGTRRADVLLHVCTHAEYTTAQVVNMFRHLGVAPLPDVMLITLARRQMREQQHLA